MKNSHLQTKKYGPMGTSPKLIHLMLSFRLKVDSSPQFKHNKQNYFINNQDGSSPRLLVNIGPVQQDEGPVPLRWDRSLCNMHCVHMNKRLMASRHQQYKVNCLLMEAKYFVTSLKVLTTFAYCESCPRFGKNDY